jgi:HEAT repeat protein
MHCSATTGGVLALLALAGPVAAQVRPPARPGAATPAVPATRDLETGSHPVAEVAGKNLTQWKRELKNPDASMRARAIQAVALFGPAASEAVPLLLDRCLDRDASPRVKAVIILRAVPVNKADVPKVVEILARRISPYQEAQAIVRYEAVRTLARFADHARAAIPALVEGAEDKSCCEVRQACLAVLRQAGFDAKAGPDPRATRAMLRGLRDATAQVRHEATIGLGAMGRPADPVLRATVIKALQGELDSRDKVQAIWSYVSLMSLDKVTDAGLGAITRYVKHPDPDIRLQALEALGTIGPEAKPCVPTVLAALEDRDPATTSAACAALGHIGDSGQRVVTALLGLAARKDLAVAGSALAALVQLSAKDPRVVDALADLAQRKDLDEGVKRLVLTTVEQLKKPRK